MSSKSFTDDETGTEVALPKAGDEPGWRLYVVGESILDTRTLPAQGQVVLGRGNDAHVHIDHMSISRRHAILHLESPLRIEDLGSRNGTSLGGQRLAAGETREIRVGETIELGSVLLVVQRGVYQATARHAWSHDGFHARLDGECARAARDGRGLTVARLMAESAADEADLERVLVAGVRTDDMVAFFGPGEFEIMLLDVAPAEGQAVLDKLIARLAGERIRVRPGIAHFPKDGRSAEELIAHAAVPRLRETGNHTLIVQDPVMQQLHGLAERVAQSHISVLLLGETGVGKEVFAESLHRLSTRREGPFLRLNCAAFTETLLENELFGHEKGAFTGAGTAKPGLLETAHGGTVFLDEVGDLPPTTQVKLLRVLEERSVLRVGGVKPIAIDVRFISATNRDLEGEVAAGRFREDCYFRLNGFSLLIPPLRERAAEIEPLARSLLAGDARAAGRPRVPELSPQALELLRAYSWPGNIRELRNVMQRAALLSTGDTILPEHLPMEKMTARSPQFTPATRPPVERRAALMDELESVERQRILDALAQVGGNQSKAAKLLGISRNTLLNRLNRLDVPRPRKKET